MAFTVVGTSKIEVGSPTSPTSHTVPVPSGTIVGDTLIVGFWGGVGVEVTDARLTPVYRTGQPPYMTGAYGTATDLTDVTLDIYLGIPGVVIVIALRGDIGGINNYTYTTGVSSDLVYNAIGGHEAAIAFVAYFNDSSTSGLAVDNTVGDDADWTTLDVAAFEDTYWTGTVIKAFSYYGPDPVPQLNPARSVDAQTRSAYLVLFSNIYVPPGESVTRLRQRQSRVRTPSRTRPPDLRQRQNTA